jgi:internalin A
MEQEIRMTEEMIKAITEKFSLATVFVLELPRFAIRDINALDGCINLLHLNLSQNQITKIKGLQKCINLEWLVLAQNKIMTIEGLAGCAKLKRLEI